MTTSCSSHCPLSGMLKDRQRKPSNLLPLSYLLTGKILPKDQFPRAQKVNILNTLFNKGIMFSLRPFSTPLFFWPLQHHLWQILHPKKHKKHVPISKLVLFNLLSLSSYRIRETKQHNPDYSIHGSWTQACRWNMLRRHPRSRHS